MAGDHRLVLANDGVSPLLSWWVYSLLSNVAIIATEYFNRSAPGGWVTVLPQTALLIVLAQYCLFRTFNGAPHWFTAWMVFVIGNTLMRVVAVQALASSEVTSWTYTSLGIMVMVSGAFLVKEGLR